MFAVVVTVAATAVLVAVADVVAVGVVLTVVVTMTVVAVFYLCEAFMEVAAVAGPTRRVVDEGLPPWHSSY